MLAALLALTLAAQAAKPSREERVLELLRAVEAKEGSWRYTVASFRPCDGKTDALQAGYLLFCATESESCDDRELRRLALEVLRIYGLRPAVDVPWADARGTALLDGLDRERRVGFELRGRKDPSGENQVVEEDEGELLDDAELGRLRVQGYRVFVADLGWYSDDEDGFTPTLAFLAGLVRFLNGVTDGEDVELGGLLFERQGCWPLPLPLASAPGIRRTSGTYGPVLEVERAGTVVLTCDGASEFQSCLRRFFDDELLPIQSPAGGAPSALALKASAEPLGGAGSGPRPEFLLRVRQPWPGMPELVYETHSFACLLPSTFDLYLPFQLELELSPGRYSFFGDGARIGAAAKR